jgi:hypothetical protein
MLVESSTVYTMFGFDVFCTCSGTSESVTGPAACTLGVTIEASIAMTTARAMARDLSMEWFFMFVP